MKFIPIALLLILLASCTHNHDHDHNERSSEIETEGFITLPDDEFLDEISDEVENMDQSIDDDQTAMNNEVIEVDAAYRNPAGAVDMVVAMEVQDGVIQSITASATTYDVSGFSDKLQTLVGSTVDQAESFYAAGSSLASEAFNNAVKSL